MKSSRISTNRRHSRLARQVEEALALALAGAGNERLRALAVHSALEIHGGARVLVRFVLGDEPSVAGVEQAYEALGSARGWLRLQVAAEICRKRTPELDWQVFPSWEAVPEA